MSDLSKLNRSMLNNISVSKCFRHSIGNSSCHDDRNDSVLSRIKRLSIFVCITSVPGPDDGRYKIDNERSLSSARRPEAAIDVSRYSRVPGRMPTDDGNSMQQHRPNTGARFAG